MKLYIVSILLLLSFIVKAQPDSNIVLLQELPAAYIKAVDDKVEKYSHRITSKTEKVLTRLSRWENKIRGLLKKLNPEAEQRLFGNDQTTFSTLLQKLKQGKSIADNYKAKYDSYRDKLTTHLKYLQEQKDKIGSRYIKPVTEAQRKAAELEKDIANSEALEQFIRERKKQLMDEGLKYLGKSRYLKKINKETYYYVETLRNYKELFSDPKKAEETALAILNRIPAFQRFVEENSRLSALFPSSALFPRLGSGTSMPVVNGIATRNSLRQFLQNNTSVLVSEDPLQQVKKQLTDNNSLLNQWKNTGNGKTGGTGEMPGFTPNSQHTKPFIKRIEYGIDIQFGRAVNFLPATAEIGIQLGYKMNDRLISGVGMNYKLGLGKGWDAIRLSNEAIGFRTHLKWKIKKGLDLQGGGELNYLMGFNKIEELKKVNAWQKSALLGINKSYSVKKKLKGNLQILFDFLYGQHKPSTSPVIIRFGLSK